MALDSTKIPKGQSPEVTEKGSRNKLGVYKHLESGRQLTAINVPQADAYALQGWVWQGPIPSKGAHSVTTSGTPEDVDTDTPENKALKAKLASESKARIAAEKKVKDLTQPPKSGTEDEEAKA